MCEIIRLEGEDLRLKRHEKACIMTNKMLERR